MGYEDRDIIKECLDGNAEKFGLLVDRYQQPLYNTALRMLGDPDDAADVTQTAFVKAFQNLSRYRPEHEFFSWIYRMLVNEAIDTINHRRRMMPVDIQIPSPAKNPEEMLVGKEIESMVNHAVGSLGDTSRVIIVLRHFAQLSYDEIAYVLEIPEKTVKSRLFTARQQLGEMLSRKGMSTYE